MFWCAASGATLLMRLLSKPNMQLADAIQTAQSMEAAEPKAKKLHGGEAALEERIYMAMQKLLTLERASGWSGRGRT